MLKMENRNGGKWLVFNLTVVCFVFVGVECQIVDQGSVVPPLCDMCECTSSPSDLRGSKSDLRVACSFTPGQELLSLDKIEWPEDYGDERVFARFEGLGLTTIQKLPRNDRLLLLSFNNNAIRTIYPEAFSELKSLEFLHLSNNDLAEVTPDIFKNLARLEQLDLSANKLSDFNPIDFAELTSLKTLNLNKNNLMKVPSHALSKLQHLEELNLSENNLFLLNFGDVKESGFVLENLKYLILASNKITVVSKGTFEQAQKLVYLDLSNNVLESIEDGALSELSSLRELDLSGNRLKAPGALPPSLVMARLQNNLVADWPQLPAGLQLLNLAENQLTTMYHNIQLDSLQILNISKNVLSSFEIGRPFPELELLDISFNLFQEVPEALSSLNFPNLRTFRVDGNPMKKLIFPSEVSLARISASFLREVTSIDASSFAKVSSREGSEMAEEGETACLDVSISNCEGLVTIHEETFQGMKLCHLDLSHNNLSSLRENVADWNSVLHGVNLQNNPWNCDCFLQWMLDILLKKLYTDYPMYLHELKCEFPRAIQGLRLVHWFNHGESAFCSGNVDIDRSSNYIMAKSTNSQDSGIRLILGSGTFKIVILVCIGVGLLLVVALGVYLVRGKYRHNYRVRRQMMKKRQQMTDAKKLNSIRVEQNEALTA